ncbi:DUF3291 domain-containing protein [Nocardia sp. alder85J]|uniref:DUF3291 domain-containing protein n=1 Tax=Nocardia sp. alder85J TaxID=2862949 RepID=UPI001CD34698|nr:DUF3291 domain-containing protein [Nocardia sp. alder85J]MCX4091984.1 DUF3291 domain-containing protein [Nocardia sp. alder85J]
MTATPGHRLAFTTFFVLKQAYGHPEVRDFEDAEPAVFETADTADGFVDRARSEESEPLPATATNFDRNWGPWGRFAVPVFYTEPVAPGRDRRSSTLSIWRDITTVRNYVYSGLHRDALKRRTDWSDPTTRTPNHAAWWIPSDRIPTWSDAVARLEQLHTEGPTPNTFTLRTAFHSDGSICRP